MSAWLCFSNVLNTILFQILLQTKDLVQGVSIRFILNSKNCRVCTCLSIFTFLNKLSFPFKIVWNSSVMNMAWVTTFILDVVMYEPCNLRLLPLQLKGFCLKGWSLILTPLTQRQPLWDRNVLNDNLIISFLYPNHYMFKNIFIPLP